MDKRLLHSGGQILKFIEVAAQQGRGDMILNGTEDGNRVFPKMFVRLSWNTGANAIVQTS